MVKAINRIHSQNTLSTNIDDGFYIYLDGDWSKPFYMNSPIAVELDTYARLEAYDKTLLKDGDVIKVDYDTPHVDPQASDPSDNNGYYKFIFDKQNYEYLGKYHPVYKNNYYKYFDTDMSTLSTDKFHVNDYVISYKSKTNHLKYSETFNEDDCKINGFSQWSIISLSGSNEDNYRFPNTGKVATKFQTYNDKDESTPTEHSISQICYTTSNELYIASCMVKQSTTTTNNIAFQLFDDTYNIGITAKYNLNDTSGYDAYGYKSVPTFYLNSNFNPVTTSPVINHLENVSAGLYRIESNSDYYYRLVIKFSCDFNSQMRVKFLLLNNNSDYIYFSKDGQEKYIIYANAFQLEKYKDLSITKPSEYMITNDKNTTLKLLDKIYKVYNDPQTSKKILTEVYNNLYYVYNVKERTEVIPGMGVATYLDSFYPAIDNPINGDIAISPSLISFSSQKNLTFTIVSNTFSGDYGIAKTYEKNNKTPKNNDYVKVKADETHSGKETIYRYKNGYWIYVPYDDSVICFGEAFNIDNEDNTINYDIYNSQYRIKKGNSFKILSYESEVKNRKSMVKAMTFNQGYFETWCKQDRENFFEFGYNTGGGMNFTRLIKIFPNF